VTSATFEEGNGRVGVLVVHAPPGRTFTQDEREFLQAVAHVVGSAIARERAGHLQVQGERLRRLEAVAASIGHDLNNVLGVVLNYGQFAVEAAADQPELRADVMEIIEAAERAIALAASLMASGGAGLHGAGVAGLDAVDTDTANGTDSVRAAPGEPIDSGPQSPQDGQHVENLNGAAGRGPAPLGLGEKILVVEDEEAVRRVTSRILSESGYEILVAESFEAAATVWEAHRPTIDLLLTDVALGTRSGADLADMLWQTAPELPVLFISGRTGDVALGRGGDRNRRTAVVEKPLGSESLLRSVCAALEGRS
jgi:CheY-like chemotaxis protein